MQKQIVFLDMDGVLSDFAQQAQNLCQIDVHSFVNRTTALTPVELAQQDKVFQLADYSNDFWETMPKMPFAISRQKRINQHLVSGNKNKRIF